MDIESRIPRPINFQLAPDINRAASPSTNPGLPWSSRPPAVPAIYVRLAPAIIFRRCQGPTSSFPRSCIRAPPVDQLPTFVEYCLLRLHLRTNFQLFIGLWIFQLTFQPTVDSRRPSTFQFCLWTRPPACAGHRILQLRLHARPPTRVGNRALRICLPTQPPTLHRISRLQLHPPANRRLAPTINLPDLPSVLTSGFRRTSHLRAFPSHPASGLRRNLHPPVLSAIQPSFSIGV